MKCFSKHIIVISLVTLLGLVSAHKSFGQEFIALNVNPDYQQTASPNDTVSFTFWAINAGITNLTVTDFSTLHVFQYGTWTFDPSLPTNFTLTPGEALGGDFGSYLVNADAPNAANEFAIFTIVANGTGTVTDDAFIDILISAPEVPEVPAVPEPASLVLLGSGLVGLVRKKFKK